MHGKWYGYTVFPGEQGIWRRPPPIFHPKAAQRTLQQDEANYMHKLCLTEHWWPSYGRRSSFSSL